MAITPEMKRKCVERELGYRRRVYARRVSEGKMTEAKAAIEIATMEAILADYPAQPPAQGSFFDEAQA